MLLNCEGKEVRGSEGHKVGKVVRCDGDELVVETGIFKVDDFTISMDEVASVTESVLFLRRPAHFYSERAPRSSGWSPWHSGRRDAEAREDLETIKRADREHRLGAQGMEALADQARTSCPKEADVLDSETHDVLGKVDGLEHDPLTPEEPRGSPPEARLPPVAHPEDEPWP